MPAKSKKQQQFFGVVRSMQKGDIPKKGEAGKVAGDMKKKSVKDFAKTKHKGLPTKVKKENVMNVKKWIQQEIRTALKEIDGGAPLVAPDGTIQGGPTKKKKGLGDTRPLGEADVFGGDTSTDSKVIDKLTDKFEGPVKSILDLIKTKDDLNAAISLLITKAEETTTGLGKRTKPLLLKTVKDL